MRNLKSARLFIYSQIFRSNVVAGDSGPTLKLVESSATLGLALTELEKYKDFFESFY